MKLKDITRLNKLEVGMKVYDKYDLKIIEGWEETVFEPIEDCLICYRAWSAWDAGTMTENDFMNVQRDEDTKFSIQDYIGKLLHKQAKLSYQQGREDALTQISKIPKIEFIFSDVKVALTNNQMTNEELDKSMKEKGFFQPLRGENYFVPRIFNGKATYQEAVNREGRNCWEYRTKEAAIAKAQKQIDERNKKDVTTKTENMNTPPKEWKRIYGHSVIRALPKTWKGLWGYFLYVISRKELPVLVNKEVTMSLWIKSNYIDSDVKLNFEQPNE